MTTGLFELIDATGGGGCLLREDETVEVASSGFVAMTGAPTQIVGTRLSALLAELPHLDQLPEQIEAETPVFRQVGADGIGRELAAVYVRAQRTLLLVDRSGEARLRRNEARLGRQIDDLKAELAAREREPQRPKIRSMAELARRLDEALMRSRRYKHEVTVISIQLASDEPLGERAKDIGETLISCVRGVDDLGRVDPSHWVLILPHTPLAGGEVVAKRILDRLSALELSRTGLGVAQAGTEETGNATVDRADQAGAQALEAGGGLLLAVALV